MKDLGRNYYPTKGELQLHNNFCVFRVYIRLLLQLLFVDEPEALRG